jgi:hypothetical protein
MITVRRWRRPGWRIAGLVLAGLLVPQCGVAQVVIGRVLDEATRAPVPEVLVAALDTAGAVQVAMLSDSAGVFQLELAAGTYALRLERLGYTTLTTETMRLRRSETVTVEVRLGARAIALEPLVVLGRSRPAVGSEAFYRRMDAYRKVGIGRFMTRAQIDSSGASTVHMLLARDPAIRLMRYRFHEVVAFQARGTTCLPALYIDGVRVANNAETDISAWLHPDMLEGVEIYPDPAFVPGELRIEGCGALALWSRSGRGNPFTLKRVLIAAGFLGAMLLFVLD